MELYVLTGGQSAPQAEEASIVPGAWTVFPVGWPGPEPSYGIVRSVGATTAMVYDVSFGMETEFRLDLVEVVTPEVRALMSAADQASLDKARKQAAVAVGERRAA